MRAALHACVPDAVLTSLEAHAEERDAPDQAGAVMESVMRGSGGLRSSDDSDGRSDAWVVREGGMR